MSDRPPTDGDEEEGEEETESPATDAEEAPPAEDAAPADGEEPPADGEEAPAEGEEAPAEGEEAPAEGEEAPPEEGEEGETGSGEGEEPPPSESGEEGEGEGEGEGEEGEEGEEEEKGYKPPKALEDKPKPEEGAEDKPKTSITFEDKKPGEEDDESFLGELDDDDPDKPRSEGGAEGKVEKKKRHSMSAHLQAELTKQKMQRAKQDRENRRSDLDTHHIYLIEMVAAHLDLKPKDVEEFVIDSADYMKLLESFFDKKGKKAVLFTYHDALPAGPESGRPIVPSQKKEKIKRLMVTDGKSVPMRGECMYFYRTQNDHKITMKTIADDVFFGVLDIRKNDDPGIVVESVHNLLTDVYYKMLKLNSTWINIPDPETSATIRLRFLTNIDHYADFLAESRHDIASRLDLREVSDMDEVFNQHLKTAEEVIEASRNPEVVAKVEHTVIQWCKNFEKVLAMSKQMRKETDTMGPLAELAYWRNLMAKMCYIIQQTQQINVQNFIQVLIHAKSRVLKRWRDVDTRVTDEYHEAKDNVRYMYALEKFCTPLYQTDPPGMIEHINSMMYVIRTIHTTSRYYNTCEKVTALMVKISNQMIASCRRYLTNDDTLTAWDQEKKVMLDKLNKCIELYEVYRNAYEATKEELANDPDGKRFNLSVNNIFGRFEKFCERLNKIIQIVEIFDLYTPVHESHIDGLEEISERLKNLHNLILGKVYDPFDFRKPDFDEDFVEIRSTIDDIQESLEKFMNQAIEACPTCMHGLTLLARFQNLKNPCLDIEGRNWYCFQFYHNEIELILQIYEAEKNDTPIPRGYPPFAGKIAWARHLYRRIERPMKWFEERTTVLTRDDAKPTIKLFNGTCKKLTLYEILVHESWVKTCNFIYDALEAPILTLRGNVRQELVLNFDPFFRQIIDETEIIRKLGLEVPDIALVVYFQKDRIFNTYEKIKGLLERYLLVKHKVPQDLAVLLRPLLKKVEKAFMPGVTNINWTSLQTEEYFDYIDYHQQDLEEIIKKAHEILNLRINQYLFEISHTLMIDFPEDRPTPVNEYMDIIKHYGVVVAKELEYKSRMCEQSVVELINMLLRTCEMPTPVDQPTLWLNPNASIPNFNEGEIVVEKPPVDPSIQLNNMSHEEQAHIYEECRNVFQFYNQKCIEALQKTTRISLDILRQRTEEPQVSKRNAGKALNRIPLFTTDLVLTIPTIQLKPPLADIQALLNRSIVLITECLKRVVMWGQGRRTSFDEKSTESYYKDGTKIAEEVAATAYPRLEAADALLQTTIPLENMNARLKNSYKPVMEYKDISKMVLMMQTVVLQAKPTAQSLIAQYSHYSFLWKDTRDLEIRMILDKDPVITEVYAIMKSYTELEDEIEAITPAHRVGPLDILTAEMKMGFLMEVKEWKTSLCRQMAEKYKIKALEITKFIEESTKELNTPINDMNDIRYVMNALAAIRAKQVDIDTGIIPIEECNAFLAKEKYRIPDDDSNRADGLRYNFNILLGKALEVQNQITGLQDKNKEKLNESVTKFKTDLATFYGKYVKSGPMVEGLAAQNASDRLVVFQDEFDELWERYLMFNAAEKLFGITPTEYPDLMKLHRELSLLQKLYGLYNDVMRSVDAYYDIRWTDLKIPKIYAEIREFQKRCKALPKALLGWPAFEALKQKIEDFEATCPLLELMTNRAMKDRHWEKIGDITSHVFNIESENFSLKHVMEAPILKFKDQVEDTCIGAQQERDMENKLKQLATEWSAVPLHFAHFKNRGEILLKEEETCEAMILIKRSIKAVQDMIANKYHGFYKKELNARLGDYTKTLSILEMWLQTQTLWVDMEAVFVGGDIARNIPLEAKRFNNSNRNWMKIMQGARENPFVVSFCVSDEFMTQILPHLKEQLELCDKAVKEFMEQQRIAAEEAAAKKAEEEDDDWW